MYGMTTLAPSINFTVDGFGFLLGFALLEELCWIEVVFGLFEGDPFPLQGTQV